MDRVTLYFILQTGTLLQVKPGIVNYNYTVTAGVNWVCPAQTET